MLNWIKTLLPGSGRGDPAATENSAPAALVGDDHRKRGNEFLAAGDLRSAEECYRRSVAAHPGVAGAHVALGFVLFEQQRLAEARHCLDEAVSIDPREADGHYLLGRISQQQNRIEEATGNFSRALAINPEFAEAHYDLGVTLRIAGRLDEALRCFDKALALRPDYPEARFNKSLVLLLRGNFAEGLELFESRLGLGAPRQLSDWLAFLADHPEKPRWRGEHLGGKRLLVWMEEGMGDCLMTMRYLPKLAEKGAGKVLVLADPALARLARTFPAVGEITSRVDELSLDSFDLHCPMMSLPYAFGTRADTIPDAVPYLSVPNGMRETWSGRLSETKRPRVGLAWSGNKNYGRDALRSLSFRQMEPLMGVSGAGFVSLQKGGAATELRQSDWPILDRMNECEDFLDTAALIANLDLVVSVDTSVAHLAGALGKPVWLLNRFESEWRWQLRREDSPWYPTMRIFNQPALGDWDSVLEKVAGQLARFAQGGKGSNEPHT